MPKVGMPEIRKPQLIDATMKAINDVGLHKASVAMIGAYAGVSPAIINHYFGGKDGLLEATMRSVLQDLAKAIQSRLAETDRSSVVKRIVAVVDGNFDPKQLDSKVVKTWLTFWSYAMHKPQLHRLQRVNEKRLLSYLRYELKQVMPHDEAVFVAQGVAALIDGIWLRGALSPHGIDQALAQALILDYLRQRIPSQYWPQDL
ncbi:transcriptional regulator, TetR family [Oceanospirillum multiglobuliferum]|uniref:HTH-type transcriptional regulator BetI n=1 Tax=Oceanospirillum multiglobuliferum TaxID=64969 RepID=A0A1T4MIU5_9GAMM|nr:transcriptional regulator BetI [Oceanospirillum multiglobuliferum]OPX57009.1 transcriptional regulator BetI [Oceanospirillum multiglobuliferum]SJZ66843.1 transcriptional regulator, TetR family [Oceanospirillum multiglobuliferum]